MSDLNRHAQRKMTLINWYERVRETPLLLSNEITPDALRERRDGLERERFVVAICGQMKAGKSTLMNALLFQDSVLPMSPTTMTAKITLMEGAVKPSVEATLYTPDEWAQVLAAARRDATTAEELAAAREAAREAGLREADLLCRPARVLTEEGLGNLVRYVGVPDDGGIYSPYVGSVVLRADLPWLHQVTVADTPGTSDPNPERDKLTKHWIQHADAVIYVTYAGQAGMDAEDVRFLDDHLLHVPPARRIIAVNKCDGIPGVEQAVWTHLRGIRDRDLRMRSLLADEDQIVLVVGLAGLIRGMLAAGRSLDDELEEWRPSLEAAGWLDGGRDGLERLRVKVEERILATRGDSLIDSHAAYLRSLFERAVRRLEGEAGDLNGQRDLLSADGETRAEERMRIAALVARLGDEVKERRDRLNSDINDALDKAGEKNGELVVKVTRSIRRGLDGQRFLSNLAAQGRWLLSLEIQRSRGTLTANLRGANDAVRRAMDDMEQTLTELVQRAGIGDRRIRRHFLMVDSNALCREAIDDVMGSVSVDALADVVEGSARWWQRAFNTETGRSNVIESLEPQIGEALTASVRNLEFRLKEKLGEVVEKAVEQVESEIRTMLDGRERILEELAADDRIEAAKRAQIDKRLETVEDELATVRGIAEEFVMAMEAR